MKYLYGETQAGLTEPARNLAGVGFGNAGSEQLGISGRILHAARFAYSKHEINPPVCVSSNDWGSVFLQTLGMAKKREAVQKKDNFLVEWRQFRDMTGTELALLADTDKGSISLWESCKRPIPGGKLPLLAKALKTTKGAILDYDPTTIPLSVLEIWCDIPEEDRDRAISILNTFRRKAA